MTHDQTPLEAALEIANHLVTIEKIEDLAEPEIIHLTSKQILNYKDQSKL